MTPALSVLLCLGLCLCKRTRTQAADRLPKPSLRAENGSLVPQGGAVTLRCRGSWEAEEWRLEKKRRYEWSEIKSVRQARNEGEFSLPSVTSHHAGTYGCLYRHSSFGWSERSDPLELVVTVNLTQEGTYRCFGFYSSSPSLWSFPSAPLLLRVSGTSEDPHSPQSSETPPARTSSPPKTFSTSPASEKKPSDAAALDYTVGNLVRLILAGLVLVLLGVLLIEHWKSSREQLVQGVLG